MNALTPIEGALLGALNVVRPLIDQTIAAGGRWSYQYGEAPVYTDDFTVVDGISEDSDVIELRFQAQTDPLYPLRLNVTFLHGDGEYVDDTTVDVHLEEGRVLFDPELCNCHHPEYNRIMDLGTLIHVISQVDLCQKTRHLMQEEIQQATQEAQDKATRRARLSVIPGAKHD